MWQIYRQTVHSKCSLIFSISLNFLTFLSVFLSLPLLPISCIFLCYNSAIDFTLEFGLLNSHVTVLEELKISETSLQMLSIYLMVTWPLSYWQTNSNSHVTVKLNFWIVTRFFLCSWKRVIQGVPRWKITSRKVLIMSYPTKSLF